MRIDPNRFMIRPTCLWDDEWLFKITGNPDAVRYMGFPAHDTIADTRRMLEIYDEVDATFIAVCMVDAPGELLGVIGYEVVGSHATVSIKLNLEDRRARGIGRLVCKPFVHALLKQPSIWRVSSYCHVDNVPGHRVTERSGAKLEGIMRRYAKFPNISDEPQDCRLYAITKDDVA